MHAQLRQILDKRHENTKEAQLLPPKSLEQSQGV